MIKKEEKNDNTQHGGQVSFDLSDINLNFFESLSSLFQIPEAKEEKDLKIEKINPKINLLVNKLQDIVFGVIKSKALADTIKNENLCPLDIFYAGKELLSGGSSVPCTYLTEEDLKNFLVTPQRIENEVKLVYPDGAILNTENFTSKFGDGYAAYAISPNNELYIHEHVTIDNLERSQFKKQFYHSSFFSGKPGYCFGMIKISDGQITYIDNRSGHYKPSKEKLSYAVNLLKDYFKEDAIVYCSQSEKSDGLMQWMFQEDNEGEEVSSFLKRVPPTF